MADWRNRIIERKRMRVGDLEINRYNPKHHPQVQQERLQAVLDKFGIVGDLVAYYSERNEGKLTLFDGHARQGLDPDAEWEVEITDLDDSEVDELVLYFDPLAALARQEADRTAALMADLDVQERALREMLEEQAQGLGFAYGKNGKEEQEAPEAELDRADELHQKWGVALGDIWAIGENRLVCGDSSDEGIMAIATNGMRPILTLTDPPYGISVVKGLRATDGGSKPVTIGAVRGRRPYPFGGVKNMRGTVGAAHMVDATPYRPVEGDDKPFDPQPLLKMADDAIIFGGNYFASKLPDSRCWIVWDKNNTGNFADAELAWTSFDKGVKLYKYTWNGLVREGKRSIEGVKRFHPTQKPVGLFVEIIKDFTQDGAVVIDPYLGSGTTLLACQLAGCKGIGIEIDPAYVAVTLQRLQDMGLDPRLVE